MSEVDFPEGKRMRGFRRITAFLRVELDEPNLPEHRVKQWAKAGKIQVDRFGHNVTATPERLRANLAGERAA
jgi:hypothetical protein